MTRRNRPASSQSRPKTAKTKKWASDDKAVSADIRNDGKTYTFALKAKDAGGFGDYIAENLADLYQAYRSKQDQQGV